MSGELVYGWEIQLPPCNVYILTGYGFSKACLLFKGYSDATLWKRTPEIPQIIPTATTWKTFNRFPIIG